MTNSSGFEIFMSGALLISSIVRNECLSMKIVQLASQARGGRVNVYMSMAVKVCAFVSTTCDPCLRQHTPYPLLTDFYNSHHALFSNRLLREKLNIQWLEKSFGPKSFF